MGSIHKFAASIGCFGDDLDPLEITTALGAEPSMGCGRVACGAQRQERKK